MLNLDSLTEKWITDQSKKVKTDPALIEKVNRAVYLLELLQGSDLNFTFKGGTALMLLASEPKRFSIDIDIIVSDKPANIEKIFDEIIKESDFTQYHENKREESSDIEKTHFKFFYESVTSGSAKHNNIMLDILFEDIHYEQYIQQLDITSPFGKTEGDNKKVQAPTPEAILGDKLTAFAPNTTGISYGEDKPMEIIKQLFDIGHLFDQIEQMDIVAEVFDRFARTEIAYRNLNNTEPKDVLNDISDTALLICTKGKAGHGNYKELHNGIKNIKPYIFSEHFHLEKAIVPAAKAAYLATLILNGPHEIKRFSNPEEIKDMSIKKPFETRLNKLKKTSPEAFFYWYQAYLLMKDDSP